MKINLAKSAGFCFGVKRALDIAFKAAKIKNEVYMLADIVHNEDVIRQIKRAGIKKIRKLNHVRNIALLIQAHGTGIKILEKARKFGYKIIDATCPMVKEIHKIARHYEKKNYKIIIIGDKRHNEVLGIIGQLKNNPIIIENIKDIPLKALKKIKKAATVVQSTQNLKKTFSIVNILSQHINKFKFINTICKPTRIKQQEINIMPLKNDIMIIIGSKTSANTKRLYQISKALNKHSYWIQNKDEIKPGWFKNARNVGITAGASTPDYTTKGVIRYIKKLKR